MNLATALIVRQVRAKMISTWTGLPATRVGKLRKRLLLEMPHLQFDRHSGPFPEKLRDFFRCPRTRNEAAALCALCRAYGVIPSKPVPDAARYLPSVARGEQLVRVYDLYRALVPSSAISCEQLMGLLLTIVSGETHDIGVCEGARGAHCRATILIDLLLASARRLCDLCMHVPRPLAAGADAGNTSDDEHTPQNIQVTLFDLMDQESAKGAASIAAVGTASRVRIARKRRSHSVLSTCEGPSVERPSRTDVPREAK